MNTMDRTEIKKAIIKSQHCQRNWDLSKSIPQEDIDLIVNAATQCPSKQNLAFYKAHFITDRNLIDQIHEFTRHPSRHPNYETETNSQILANLIIVFEKNNFYPNLKTDIYRNEETRDFLKCAITEAQKDNLKRDAHMAVGIAAGYVSLTSNILGYSTGCCACFDSEGISKLLNLENEPLLLMGIGFKDPIKNRREHHQLSDLVFSTKVKQPIPITFK
jgi:nitroreductase